MRIKSIFAKNVFNFGPQGIEWKDIPDRSILVGPNGSGKTNIFRLLTLVADSFLYSTRSQHPELENRLSEIFLRGDSEARLEFELADDEVTAIFDWLTLVAFGQDQDFRRNWEPLIQASPDPSAAGNIANESERVVKKILKGLTDSFRNLLGDSITLVIQGTGNPRNPVKQFAIIRDGEPRLFSTASYQLTTDPNLGGGPQVIFPEFVWRKFKEFCPEAGNRGSSDSASNDKDADRFVREKRVEWLEAFPSTEARVLGVTVITFQNQGQALEAERIPFIRRLRGFLNSRFYSPDSIGLIDLIGLIFRGSIVHVSEIRSRPFNLPVTGLHTSSDKTLTLDGSGLAPFLFWMKNALSNEDRDRFRHLQDLFRNVTGSDLNFNFDIAVYAEPVESEKKVPNLIPEVRFVDLNSSTELSSDFVPGSVIETLTLLASVVLAKIRRGVLLLDEPALNLHPTMQRKLAEEILGMRKQEMGFQCFLVTHSPSFIPNDGEAIGSIFRLCGSNVGVTLRSLSDDEVPYLCLKAWHTNPQLRASLFARKVILVEGEDEEAALPIWFRKCNGGKSLESRNVMFISVHGDQNFRVIAMTLSLWGIPVIGIGDSKAPRVDDVSGFCLHCYELADFSKFYTREPYKRMYKETQSSARKKMKDPLVARTVAEATDPPKEICMLWDKIKDFVLGP